MLESLKAEEGAVCLVGISFLLLKRTKGFLLWMGEKVGEKWSSRQSNLSETRFPYLYDEKVVLDTSRDPPGLTLWPCPSPKAFMGFIKMPGMSSLGQGSASDIGKGDGSRLVPSCVSELPASDRGSLVGGRFGRVGA